MLLDIEFVIAGRKAQHAGCKGSDEYITFHIAIYCED